MEARFYIQPRFDSSGTFLPEVEVTDHVINSLTLRQRPERNKWIYGIVSSGEVKLDLVDDGRYSEQSNPASMFSFAGRDRAGVRIAYSSEQGSDQETTIWRGWSTSRETQTNPLNGRTTLFARTLDSVLQDEVIGGGNIIEGLTLTEVVERAFNEAEVANALPGELYSEGFVDPTLSTLIVEDALSLLGSDRNAREILQRIMLVTDALVSYDFASGRPVVFKRGGLPVAEYPVVELDNILSIKKIEDGSEGVHNQFIMRTGLEAPLREEIVVESEASIHDYGLASVDIDCAWLQSEDACLLIGDLLVSRLSTPRQAITFEIDAWAIPPASMVIGQQVDLAIPPEAIGTGATFGSSRFGDSKYTATRHERYSGRFWIEEISQKVKSDTIIITLRRGLE